MRRPYQILWPLLSLFLVRVDLTDLWPWYQSVQVLEVIDGDTVLIGIGARKASLRLAKIDAPEMRQPFINQKASAGLFSKECAQRLLKKMSPVLRFEKVDIYGRLLGDIGDLSFQMIAHGCAGLYPHAVFQSRHEKYLYLRAWKEARQQRLGLWKYGGYRQPKLWRKESKKR